MLFRRIIALMIVLMCATLLGAEGGWVNLSDEDNVTGYSRAVDGSNILEYRSTVIVDARIEVVGAVLRNVDGLKDNGNCVELRILEKKDSNNYTFYIAYSYSGPIASRDIIVKVTTVYDIKRGRVVSDLVAVKDSAVPEREGFVRITDYRSQFVIEYISREKTGVVFTSRVDPGGYIPAFIVNYMGKKAIYSGAIDLRNAVRKKEYIDAAAGSKDRELVEKIVNSKKSMKEILRNRLGEYIKDEKLIAMFLDNSSMFEKLCQGEGEVSEIILHGWGSQESRMRAAEVLLRQYLLLYINDIEKVNRLIRYHELAEKALVGTKCAESVQYLISGGK